MRGRSELIHVHDKRRLRSAQTTRFAVCCLPTHTGMAEAACRVNNPRMTGAECDDETRSFEVCGTGNGRGGGFGVRSDGKRQSRLR